MADEMDKGHDATPFKLMEARRKGQVAKSTELISFFSLFAMLIVLIADLNVTVSSIASKTAWWLESAHKFANQTSYLWGNLFGYSLDLARIVLTIVIAGLIATIIGSIIYIGPIFSGFPLKPDFSRINPATGFKRIFSMRSVVDLFRLIIKVIVFCWVFYLVINHRKSDFFSPDNASIDYVLLSWKAATLAIMYSGLGVFFFFAVFDVWYSKRMFSRQMRMSSRDIKDESRRHEGDPQIKAKRKRVLSELLKNSASIKNVKDSDVIITNPTHIAVALKYRPNTMAAPIVVAKGKGLLAAGIKYQARKYGVPVIRKPLLARALLKQVNLAQPIPNELQVNVASIYRWIVSMPRNRVFT